MPLRCAKLQEGESAARKAHMKRLLLIVLVLLAACGNEPSSPATRTRATHEALFAQLSEELARAEERWAAAAIDDYEIGVHYFTFGMEIYTHLVVRDNKVVETSCEVGTMFDETDEGQCGWFKDASDRHTVPGLFASAHGLINDAKAYWGMEDEAIVSLEFEAKHGYPTVLIWHPPEYTRWEVTSFKPLD
jgi:hypothetical protein